MQSNQVEWVAVDWGTSNLRVWLFSGDGEVIDHAVSDRGMGQLTPDQFEPALLDMIGDHLQSGRVTPVICCGMVGARQGWVEAPYATAPCTPPSALQAVKPAVRDPRLEVYILPGIKQDEPADVMRGEETQIAGFLSSRPEYDGVLCLPGTHTKWVHISAGEIVSFRTFMTGELFALLSKQSVLRHSLAESGWVEEAFNASINDAMSSPHLIASRLFSFRAESLLHGVSSGMVRARLSGYLIGLELAGARPYWLGREVVIIGADRLAGHYANALSLQGTKLENAEGGALTLAGLSDAYSKLKDTES